MASDSVGTKQKNLEETYNTKLPPKIPVMGRLDGRAFHTFTKKWCEKPYDAEFHKCIWNSVIEIANDISGLRVAYCQSDEITILITDFGENQQPWFDNRIQKLSSVTASLMTGAFIKHFAKYKPEILDHKLPVFDARFWSIPEEEVAENFLWRQSDAIKNSISSLGFSLFSHRQLFGLNSLQIREKAKSEKGIDWNSLPDAQKWGVCIRKEVYRDVLPVSIKGVITQTEVARNRWVVEDIPCLSESYFRNFIRKVSPDK